MNESIVEMSHAISSTSQGINPASYLGGAKSPKATHLSPKDAPKYTKKIQQETEKKNREMEEEIQLRKKSEYASKIEQYLSSPKLAGYFQGANIKVPHESHSLEAFEGTYNLIKKMITMESKRFVVDNFFETVVTMGEEAAVNLLGREDIKGFSEFCLHPQVKDQLFQPELEEISIEISDALVPNPYTRLGIKLFRAWKDFKMMQELERQQELKETQSNEEKFEERSSSQSESSRSNLSSSKPQPRPRKTKSVSLSGHGTSS